MYCTACGTKNAVENNFCRQCGHALEKPTTHPVSEAAFESALPEEERVSSLLERAYRHRKEGDIAAAIACCEEALTVRPDSTSAHSLLGQLYEHQGMHDQAIRQYERVLELNPGSIADRVKLDELRGNTRAVSGSALTTPHIVLTRDPAPAPRTNPFAFLLVGAGLITVGAAIALIITQRSNVSTPRPETGNGSTNTVQTRDPGSTVPQRPAGEATGQFAYNPPAFIPQSVPETRVIYVPTPSQPAGSTANRMSAQPRQPVQPPFGQNDRIIMPPPREPDEITSDVNGKVTIPVIPQGKKPKPRNPEDGNSVRISPRPKSAPDNSTSTTPEGHTPSSDSRSFIAMGDDLKMKEQYSRAIAVYRRALPDAGDQAGFVCQSIASCYQSRNDKNAAKTFFQKAVDEFQKLDGAGRLTETGRSAMTACELGIKICENG